MSIFEEKDIISLLPSDIDRMPFQSLLFSLVSLINVKAPACQLHSVRVLTLESCQ